MKKNILGLFMLIFLTALSAQAATDKVHVEILEEFNTENPAQSIDVKVLESSLLGNYLLKEGDIIHCKVVEVTDPKRGKRAASFSVRPTSYTSEGNDTEIKENYCGRYAEKVLSKEELKNVDAVKVGKKAAITVGGHFVKGLAPAVSLAKGIIKNDEGNRIESGVKQVYEDSPLSLAKKGQELHLDTGKEFYLIFKPAKDNISGDTEN